MCGVRDLKTGDPHPSCLHTSLLLPAAACRQARRPVESQAGVAFTHWVFTLSRLPNIIIATTETAFTATDLDMSLSQPVPQPHVPCQALVALYLILAQLGLLEEVDLWGLRGGYMTFNNAGPDCIKWRETWRGRVTCIVCVSHAWIARPHFRTSSSRPARSIPPHPPCPDTCCCCVCEPRAPPPSCCPCS